MLKNKNNFFVRYFKVYCLITLQLFQSQKGPNADGWLLGVASNGFWLLQEKNALSVPDYLPVSFKSANLLLDKSYDFHEFALIIQLF